jgi:two-component sensor histidine kinase
MVKVMQMTEGASTEQCSSEARLLLREFSHRINNEFASVIGMISVAAGHVGSGEAKATLAAVQDRLHNFARVHHALQMPEHESRIDAAGYLQQLCRAICRSKLDAKGIQLVLVERPFQMDAERCWRLGMIVSELITNSARHAFRDGGGVIYVELLPSASIIECRVSDNGRSDSIVAPGNGTKIVGALAKSLGGTIDQHFGPRGATAILVFASEERPMKHPGVREMNPQRAGAELAGETYCGPLGGCR